VDNKLAAQIYELVGGRMVLLKYTANRIQSGSKLDGMCVVSLYSGYWILTLLLQMYVGRCLMKPRANSKLLGYCRKANFTNKERQLLISFSKRVPFLIAPIGLSWGTRKLGRRCCRKTCSPTTSMLMMTLPFNQLQCSDTVSSIQHSGRRR